MSSKGKIVNGVYVLGTIVRAMSKDKHKRLMRRRGKDAQHWVPYRAGMKVGASE